MTDAAAPAVELRCERVLGEVVGAAPGPTFVVLGGIHGNEPAGVHAAHRVLRKLQEETARMRGRVVALAGNLGALAGGVRYRERDLNRHWSPAAVAGLGERPAAERGPEDREQLELMAAFERYCAPEGAPVVFVDLHSSSSDGPPFSCLGDTLPNRRLAMNLPIPLILGLEECIEGAVMEWFNVRGLVAMAIEGGQHLESATADNLESSVWLLLVAAGLLPAAAVDVARHRERLRRAAGELPPVLEVRYRHGITPVDGFVMEPGYRSFQPVRKGEVLARDRRGAVRAREGGHVLPPLYQGQGDDGFFLARPFRRFWFAVSTGLRWVRADRLLSWLPGVRREPDGDGVLSVDPRVARWFVVQVFHLLGYRHVRSREGRLRFRRRWSRPLNRALGPVSGSGPR